MQHPSRRHARHPVLPRLVPLVTAVALVACADASGVPTTTAPAPTSAESTVVATDAGPPSSEVVAGRPFPTARCEANRAAGPIVFLTGNGFTATAGTTEAVVAAQAGYFEEMCLDIEVRSSFAADNYALVASNEAQFAASGSFSELVDFAGANATGFVALSVAGRTGLDALVTRPEITSLAELAGTRIGVRGALTASVRVMLARAGLDEDRSFRTSPLEGDDPTTVFQDTAVSGFPVSKSDEPARLASAGIAHTVFDPSVMGVPGSFGVVYSNSTFVREHPSAVADVVRALLRGLRDAVADPAGAAAAVTAAARASGDDADLTEMVQRARWTVEARLIEAGGAPLGVPVIDALTDEVAACAEVGLFGGVAPDIGSLVDDRVAAAVYDDRGDVVWPEG